MCCVTSWIRAQDWTHMFLPAFFWISSFVSNFKVWISSIFAFIRSILVQFFSISEDSHLLNSWLSSPAETSAFNPERALPLALFLLLLTRLAPLLVVGWRNSGSVLVDGLLITVALVADDDDGMAVSVSISLSCSVWNGWCRLLAAN